MTNVLALIAAIISFIALIITVIFSYKSYKQTFFINSINIEADYYKKIFDEYIIKHIPQSRKQLLFTSNGKLTPRSVAQFHMHLTNLMEDVQFFAFRNKMFHNDLCKCIMRLDDYLISSSNITINDNEKRIKFYKEADSLISQLYLKIFTSYLGNNNRKII